jgi:hypothetical protein
MLNSTLAFLLFWCLLGSLIDGAGGLDIAFVTSGTTTELFAIDALVQVARQRTHITAVLVAAENSPACESVLGLATCLPFLCSRPGCGNDPALFTSAALLALRKKRFSPNVVLASALLAESVVLSQHFNAPLVVLAESTSGSTFDGIPTLSSLTRSTELSRSSFSIVRNALRGFFADITSTTTSHTLLDFYAHHHVITQEIPGLDLVEGRCPNVHYVGFLRSASSVPVVTLPGILTGRQQMCAGEFTYASIAAQSSTITVEIHRLLAKVANSTNTCVLWYNSQVSTSKSLIRNTFDEKRVIMTDSADASPAVVLFRHAPLVVLADTVADVLRNAVFTESPLVYVGDRREDCDRVLQAGVGVCAALSSSLKVISSVLSLRNNTAIRDSIGTIRRMGFMMGGAQKALSVVELASQLGPENADYFCDTALHMSPYGYNGSVVLMSSFFLSLFLSAFYFACGVLFSGRKMAQ